MATAPKYFDWAFAQKVWFEMNTIESLEAAFTKYGADFDPWLALYKKDPRKAFAELDKMPKAQRLRVQRGYDVQLAYDQWFDHVYSTWYNTYPQNAAMAPVLKKAAPTFDDVLAARAQTASCHPESMLNECGPVPDWRTEGWKVKERGMMADAAKYVAEQEAKKGK